MGKFLKQALIFSGLIFFLFSVLGYIIDQGLKKTGMDNFPEWSAIQSGKVNADLVIIGNSRAWVNVSTVVLDSALKLNTYNLGLDGHLFPAQYVRYKFYEKYNKRPACIIQCVDLRMLTADSGLYMPEQYAPYLNDAIIYNGMKNYGGFSDIDYFNPFTKYQYRTRFIAVGLLEFFNIRHWTSAKHKGYEGKDLPWDNRLEQAKENYPDGWTLKLDDATIASFDAYLKECVERGVRIVLLYPPEYIEGQSLTRNRREIVELYSELARKYNIPFLNYSDDTLSTVKSYFYNTQHLNKNGSEAFTVALASDLKKILK